MSTQYSSRPPRPDRRSFDAAALLAELRPHLRIAHQVCGRVRLKLSAVSFDRAAWRAAAGRLHAGLAALPGVRAVSLNPLAQSCVVEYDPGLIPDAAWDDLLAGRDTSAASTLAELLATAFFPHPSQESAP